jgi:peptide/nickel transport system ATP-binding protein
MLSVRDLKVSFRTEQGVVRAIDGVSFDVAEGEILGVVGESGSGKTVSLLAVMGLITDPNAVIEGSIKYQGQELVGLSSREMRKLRGREIAMIFQDPMTALTPVYTIGWQIAEQIRAHNKISAKDAEQRAIDLLAEVNIPNPAEAIHRYPHQLSGGMRQRAVVRKLQKNHKSAVVFITHDMGVIAELADRVMVMYAGRIVERGTKRQLFSTPQHPYTLALLNSIPPLHGARPHRLISIPGAPPALLNRPAGCAFAPRCASRFEKCIDVPVLPSKGHDAACFKVNG